MASHPIHDTFLLSDDPFFIGSLSLTHYIKCFDDLIPPALLTKFSIPANPWSIVNYLPIIVSHLITTLPTNEYIFYTLSPEDPTDPWKPPTITLINSELGPPSDAKAAHAFLAVHKSARLEMPCTLKTPAIISRGAQVSAGAYIRGGVIVGEEAVVGPNCEVKRSVLFRKARVGHLSFIGDSIVGTDVNIEAGTVLANHFNERQPLDRIIRVLLVEPEWQGRKKILVKTGVEKFGALLGDMCTLGANCITDPGTVLEPGGKIMRGAVCEQVAEFMSNHRNGV